MVFAYAKRPGDRCGGRGGVSRCRWELVSAVRPDLEDLYHNTYKDPALPAGQQRVIWADLCQLMDKAKRCELRLGDSESSEAEAKVMQRCEAIIEIRPTARLATPSARRRVVRFARLVRFYFAEPATPADALLGLHLASKPGNRADSAEEQNRAIDTAAARAELWTV